MVTGTGDTPVKKKSFYEKIVSGEFRDRPDSKEFSDFLYGVKEQLVIAKRIYQNANKYIDPKKSVRLKRDFKSKTVSNLELKTIMIDLDETLIHSEDFMYGGTYDFVFEMDNPSTAPKKDVDSLLLTHRK